MTDEKKEAIRDKAMQIYWLMVVAAIFFALGVLYGTSEHDAEIAPAAIPGEAERPPAHLTIVVTGLSAENDSSASQGV